MWFNPLTFECLLFHVKSHGLVPWIDNKTLLKHYFRNVLLNFAYEVTFPDFSPPVKISNESFCREELFVEILCDMKLGQHLAYRKLIISLDLFFQKLDIKINYDGHTYRLSEGESNFHSRRLALSFWVGWTPEQAASRTMSQMLKINKCVHLLLLP